MTPGYLKNITFSAFIILVFACTGKKESHHGDPALSQHEWKEMDEFHMVMAETFHPFKDSANLEPAKSRAGELVVAAEKWASSPLPEKVDNGEMKDKLDQLKVESEALVQRVSSGDDKAIADQLTKVHDLFHSIQEAWYGGDSHEH